MLHLQRDSLAAYKEATANSTQLAPEIVVEPPVTPADNSQDHPSGQCNGEANGESLLLWQPPLNACSFCIKFSKQIACLLKCDDLIFDCHIVYLEF